MDREKYTMIILIKRDTKPVHPQLEVQHLNHWIAREVPLLFLYKYVMKKVNQVREIKLSTTQNRLYYVKLEWMHRGLNRDELLH